MRQTWRAATRCGVRHHSVSVEAARYSLRRTLINNGCSRCSRRSIHSLEAARERHSRAMSQFLRNSMRLACTRQMTQRSCCGRHDHHLVLPVLSTCQNSSEACITFPGHRVGCVGRAGNLTWITQRSGEAAESAAGGIHSKSVGMLLEAKSNTWTRCMALRTRSISGQILRNLPSIQFLLSNLAQRISVSTRRTHHCSPTLGSGQR